MRKLPKRFFAQPFKKTEQNAGETEALQMTTEEFMSRFREYSTECFRNAYELDRSVLRTDATGALSSSLAEDVVSLCYMQWNALRDFCATQNREQDQWPEEEELVRTGMQHVVRTIRSMHQGSLPLLWTTLETCCRAANDFYRMADKLELLWSKLSGQHPMLQAPSSRKLQEGEDEMLTHAHAATPVTLSEEWADLVRRLSCDAVASAERVQVFILRHITFNTSIASDFFSSHWERDLTDNQVMLRLIQLLDGYLEDLKQYLMNEHLWCKALLTTCRAMVCLYVRCLIEKADGATRRRRNRRHGPARWYSERQPFEYASRALRRLWDDVSMLKSFFLQRADGHPALSRMLADEVYILEVIHECLDADDAVSIEAFIVVIHKRTGADALVTRYFLTDLWFLVAHRPGKQQIEKVMGVIQPDLQLVSNRIKEQSIVGKTQTSDLAFVRIDEMLRVMYEDRIAQGMLPACWTCVPKIEANDSKIAVDGIRRFTRKLADLRWKTATG